MIEKRHVVKGMTDTSDRHIRSTHPMTQDTTMSKTIIHPPHGSFLMFVLGTSRDINQ